MPSARDGNVVTPPFGAESVQILRSALKSGRVMTYPTETSYALGGNALSGTLVDSIYRLKGRDRRKPLLLLIDGSRRIEGWVEGIPDAARALMRALWPGPLTLVFRAGKQLPAHLPDERGTVAVRWSPHPLVAELLKIGGVPLIGTSANVSGMPSLNDAQSVLASFPQEPILAVDGGPAPGGAASTVLDATVKPFAVVRLGAVPLNKIRAALSKSYSGYAPV